MELPVFLPERFQHLNLLDDELVLFETLKEKPNDLFVFFIYACEDEPWCLHYPEFIERAFSWLTEQMFLGKMAFNLVQQVARSLHHHFLSLSRFLPRSLIVKIGSEKIQTIPLLFSSISESFFDSILAKQTQISLKNISIDQFHLVETFAYTGTISSLWKLPPEELMDLLKIATHYKITGLVELCQEILHRYISSRTVINFLNDAHTNHWTKLKEYCCQFINQQGLGLRLDPLEKAQSSDAYYGASLLALEFLNFSTSALQLFEELSSIITHLICGGALPEEPEFSRIIRMCPKLLALDISRTSRFSEHFRELPSNLVEIDLSRCPWLNEHTLTQLMAGCPQLEILHLKSNTHLNYLFWGTLGKMKRLKSLDISRCHQLRDEDFEIIIKHCSFLTELFLSECRHLSDRSLLDMVRHMHNLTKVDFSRCHVGDGILAETAQHLSHLQVLILSRCMEITKKGVFILIQQIPSLKELDLTGCAIAEEDIERIRVLRPSLNIIS